MNIDQLTISLGINPDAVRQGMARAEQLIDGGVAQLSALFSGVGADMGIDSAVRREMSLAEHVVDDAVHDINTAFKSLSPELDADFDIDADVMREIRRAVEHVERGVDDMEADLNGVRADLGIDDMVRKEMSRAEDIVENGMQSIKATLAGFAAGFVMTSMWDGFVQGAADIKKYSDMLGMSMQDLQAWRGAAVAMGGSAESVDEMLIDMTEHLSDMALMASGPAHEVLPQLGISARDAAGNIKSASDVLIEMAEAGERISNEQMLAYGKIMGFDKEVIDLLQKGKGGLVDLLKAQKELAIYSKQDAEIAKKAKMAMTAFMHTLESGAAVIMRVVLPPFSALVKGLSTVISWIRSNETTSLVFFTGLAAVIGKAFVPALWSMAKAAWAAVAPFLPFIALLAAVALVVDDFVTYVQGGESALEELWSVFGTSEEISAAFAEALEISTQAVAWLWEKAKFVGKNLYAAFAPALSSVKDIFLGFARFLKALFTGDFQGMGTAFVETFQGVQNVIRNMFVGLLDFVLRLFGTNLQEVAQYFYTAFSNGLNTVKGLFQDFISFVKALFDGDFSQVADTLYAAFVFVVQNLASLFQQWIDFILGLFGTSWEAVGASLVNVFLSVIAYIESLFTSFFGWLNDTVNGIFDFIGDGIDSAKSFFGFGDDDDDDAGADDVDSVRSRTALAQQSGGNAPNMRAHIPTIRANLEGVTQSAGSFEPLPVTQQTTQNVTNTSTSTTNISKIEVNTQATDAEGIAAGIGNATKNQFNYLPHTANSGVNVK